MVLIAPFANWKGFGWAIVPEFKDSNFVVQHNSFFNQWRILIHSMKQNYQIARSKSKEEITQDWETIQTEVQAEIKRVGSRIFSEHHLLTFCTTLATDPAEEKTEEGNPALDTELLQAITSQKPKSEIMKLIQAGAKVNSTDSRGQTPLHLIALMSPTVERADIVKDYLDVAKALIAKGASVNPKDSQGWTPLHCACYSGNLNLVQLVLKSDPHLLALSTDGALPFGYLVRCNFTEKSDIALHLKMIEAMLANGVSINSQNNHGNSPLHHAAERNIEYVAKFLLSKGAQINIINKKGETPLHYAARAGHGSMVNFLLERGVDPTISGNSGTAAECAKERNFTEIYYLLRYMPAPSSPTSTSTSTSNLTMSNVDTLTVSNPNVSSSRMSRESTDSLLSSSSSTSSFNLNASNSNFNLKNSKSFDPPKDLEQSGVQPHSFKLTSFMKPTWCEYCKGFIYGMMNQGYVCETCFYPIHHTCKKDALFNVQCEISSKSPPSSPKKKSLEKSPSQKALKLLGTSKADVRDRKGSTSEPQRNLCVVEDYLEYFEAEQLDTLYFQFNAMDVNQKGSILPKEFRDGLGGILNDDVIADAFFAALDTAKDGKLDFREYIRGMLILTRGSVRQQLQFAFGLYNPENGKVTREKFENISKSIGRSLGALEFDSESFVKRIFDAADVDHTGEIDVDQYCEISQKNYRFIQSLSLVDGSPQSEEAKFHGIPISFGHQSWDLSWHMMQGVRHAVAEVGASHKRGSEDLINHSLQVQYAMRSFGNSSDPWMFNDYAPDAFYKVRERFGVDPNEYMFSLGPEKILGNLLLGNLTSLCEMVSTGRSGSFFFRTRDSKYLIKTLPQEEHALLRTLLADYVAHVIQYPNTLLTRFLGLHSMKKNSEKDINFIVMSNLYDSELPIHESYDLKGSTVNRHVETDGKNPHIARKDNDFHRRISLGPSRKAQIIEQVEKDVVWLEQHGICDYSFLVAIHFLDEPIPEPIKSDYNEDASIFRQFKGGILSQNRNEVYFLGIIDILTTYSLSKMGERFAKSLFHDSSQISAIGPAPYRARFQKYLASIID